MKIKELKINWWMVTAIVCMFCMAGYLTGTIIDNYKLAAANERIEERNHIARDWRVSERMWNLFVAWANERDSTIKVNRLQSISNLRDILRNRVMAFDDSIRKADGLPDLVQADTVRGE